MVAADIHMPATILRLCAKPELIAWLRQQGGAPFHALLWDGSPVHLDEALQRANALGDTDQCYCGGAQVFTPVRQARTIPTGPQSGDGLLHRGES